MHAVRFSSMHGALVGAVVFVAWAVPARADQCAEMRAHIAQLDRMIAQDTIANSRNLRIQDRNNWTNAYNAQCTGGGGGGGGGGYSGGGGGGGGSKAGAALGIVGGILGILGGMAEQEQQRQQDAYRGEQQRFSLLSAESNREGIRLSNLGQHEEAIRAYERAAEYARQAGEFDNVQINERNAREARERIENARRQEVDAKKRKAMANPWGTPAATSTANPFGAGEGALGGAARPATLPSANPFGAAPTARPPAAGARTAGRGVKTDAEIKAFCANQPNPAACETAEKTYRKHMGEFDRKKAEETARLEEESRRAQAELQRVLADQNRGTAAATGGTDVAAIPSAPFHQPPMDRTGDGLDKCREGDARPDTVAGCYEQPMGDATRQSSKAKGKANDPNTQKTQLKRKGGDSEGPESAAQQAREAEIARLEGVIKTLPPGKEREGYEKMLSDIRARAGQGGTTPPNVVPPKGKSYEENPFGKAPAATGATPSTTKTVSADQDRRVPSDQGPQPGSKGGAGAAAVDQDRRVPSDRGSQPGSKGGGGAKPDATTTNPEIAVAARPSDAGPPEGKQRETMMTRSQCERWGGHYHFPGNGIVPVCDYPITASPPIIVPLPQAGPETSALPTPAAATPESSETTTYDYHVPLPSECLMEISEGETDMIRQCSQMIINHVLDDEFRFQKMTGIPTRRMEEPIAAAARIQRALIRITDLREKSGASRNLQLRNAEYYLHGMYAEVSGDLDHLAKTMLHEPYDSIKAIALNTRFESLLRANPNNPNSPPGGAEWAAAGLRDGKRIRNEDVPARPAGHGLDLKELNSAGDSASGQTVQYR